MVAPVLIDTGVLWSFALAGTDALDDLQRGLDGRGTWTPVVQSEVRHKAETEEPLLSRVLAVEWLTLHEFDPDAPDAMETTERIESLRQSFGVTGGARQHLGEAESIIAAQEVGGWFFTEDHSAATTAFARGGIPVVHMTVEVLRWLVSTGTIDCSRSLTLYGRMCDAGRELPKGLGMDELCWGVQPARGGRGPRRGRRKGRGRH